MKDRLRTLRIELIEQKLLLTAAPNATPTVAQAVSLINPGPVIDRTATLSVLGADDGGESHLIYHWMVASAPLGGGATFRVNNTNAAKNEVATFTKAGTYGLSVRIIDAAGAFTTATSTVVVAPTLTTISVATPAHQTLSTTTPLKVSAASQSLVAQGLDQFGNALTTQPTFNWSLTTAPSGASPSLHASGAAAGITFDEVGNYGLSVQASAGGKTIRQNLTLSVVSQPTSFSLTQLGGASPVTNTTTQFAAGHFVDQFNHVMWNATTISWSVTAMPGRAATPTFATSNGISTVTFKTAGSYVLKATERDSLGNAVSQSVALRVSQVLASAGNSTSPIQVSGTSQILTLPVFIDRFGKNMAAPPDIAWSIVTVPKGAAAPTLTASGATTTATFAMAGTYSFKAAWIGHPNVAGVIMVNVNQTLTTITVSRGSSTLYENNTRQFTATGWDQFHNAMAAQPAVSWSAVGGKITDGGLFTAPNVSGNCMITARSGAKSASTTITVQAGSRSYQNYFLASLVQSFDADGSISRQDMIQIFRSVSAKGALTASEFADLKTILNQATALAMPGYVQVLAGDVINGNLANATFQGRTLGNLAVGSSAAQLNSLVDKWFLGADAPALSSSSYVYNSAAGSLFTHTPTHADEFQGMLGDCYFISSLGTIADSNPSAIQNMFIDNGDGTFTVRFYTGNYGSFYNPSAGSYSDGFTNNLGTADYVTVDRRLATTSSGMLVYADYGANYASSANDLWIPLAEKAYAQWNQTGKEGRDGKNAFASIEGGWMDTVDSQILGHKASDYSMAAGSKQYAIKALAAHEAVTIGTYTSAYGLVASHAYAITGYDATTDTFTLYNPWGSYQPGKLNWSQLQATCSGFVVADTAGSTPISGALLRGAFGAENSTSPAQDAAAAHAASAANPGAVAATFQGGWAADDLTDGDDYLVSTSAIDALFASDASSWDDATASAA